MRTIRSQSIASAVLGLSILAGTAMVVAEDPKPATPPGNSLRAKISPVNPATTGPAHPMPPPSLAAPTTQPAMPAQPPRPPGVPEPTVVLKPGETPKPVFDTPEYDFGRIKADSAVEHTYWFTNKGNGPLEILSVRPGCGCTTAGDFDKIVQPGESGKIPIRVNVHNPGPITKSITVHTNAPDADATVMLQIKGTLWQVVEATPNSIFFGRVTESKIDDASSLRTVSIVNNSETPAKIADVKSSDPAFKAELKETEPGKKYELSVSLVKPITKGNHGGNINMNTGITELPMLQVPVNIYVAADIEVNPDKLQLQGKATAKTTRQLFIQNYTGKALKVTDAQSSNEALKVSINDTGGGMSYRLDVEIPEGFEPAEGDKITFKTDHPTMSLVTVPIEKLTPPPAPVRPGSKLVGQPAPKVDFETVGGAKVNLGEKMDKNTVLVFYTTWCGFCRKSLPDVEKTWQKYKDNKAVRFIAISEDDLSGPRAKKPEDVNKHYDDLKLTFEHAYDWTKDVGTKYFAGSYPTMYVVSKEGKVELAHFGANDVETDLTIVLDRLLKKADAAPAKPAAAAPGKNDAKPSAAAAEKPASPAKGT